MFCFVLVCEFRSVFDLIDLLDLSALLCQSKPEESKPIEKLAVSTQRHTPQ